MSNVSRHASHYLGTATRWLHRPRRQFGHCACLNSRFTSRAHSRAEQGGPMAAVRARTRLGLLSGRVDCQGQGGALFRQTCQTSGWQP